MSEGLRHRMITPEGAVVFFGIVAAGTDALLLKAHSDGVFRPERGLDIANFMFGGLGLVTNLQFAMQVAYIGERRGIYPKIQRRAYLLAASLSRSLPPF